MTAKAILDIVPIAQSSALLGENLKFLKKKQKDVEDFTGHTVKNIVGIKLLGETANIIESF